MTKYTVTNPTITPRIIHDAYDVAKFIAPGGSKVIDLHDHDAKRLMSAKSDEVKLERFNEKSSAPPPQNR